MVTAERCRAKYGAPEKEASMVVWDVPAALEIGAIPKKIYCNRDMVIPLTRAFGNLIEHGGVEELKTWDGCFNIRAQKGAKTAPSLHSWGVAVDVNAAWNQFGKPPSLSKAFVKCFTDAGFVWGGTWKKPDGMHFQLANI